MLCSIKRTRFISRLICVITERIINKIHLDNYCKSSGGPSDEYPTRRY